MSRAYHSVNSDLVGPTDETEITPRPWARKVWVRDFEHLLLFFRKDSRERIGRSWVDERSRKKWLRAFRELYRDVIKLVSNPGTEKKYTSHEKTYYGRNQHVYVWSKVVCQRKKAIGTFAEKTERSDKKDVRNARPGKKWQENMCRSVNLWSRMLKVHDSNFQRGRLRNGVTISTV